MFSIQFTKFSQASRTQTCGQEEEEDKDGRVGEVEDGRHDSGDGESRGEVVHTVGEQVDGREARREERAPPPVVVLQDLVD